MYRLLALELLCFWWFPLNTRAAASIGSVSNNRNVDTNHQNETASSQALLAATGILGAAVTPTATLTPPALRGDIEPPGGDNDVDFNDVKTLIANFLSTVCQFSVIGDICAVDIFDYNQLMQGLNPFQTPTNGTAPSITPAPTVVANEALQSSTGHTVLPGSAWTWPLTPELQTQILGLMDTAVNQAKTRYGSSQPKLVMLENGTSLIQDFANKAKLAFPQALVVGVGPASEAYNAFTADLFTEHGNRAIAVLALGGTSITQVKVSGQYSVGQGSDAQLQLTSASRIAQDLIPYIAANERNLIVIMGPGHNPNHKTLLCGLKQGFANVTNMCDTATPDNPEKPGLPQLPTHIRVIAAAGYYNANTVVDSSTVAQSIIGTLIRGTFQLELAGMAGVPTTTSITTPVNQITQALGGTPNMLFLVPGHPTIGSYESLRQQMVTLLPGTTIFGHEGGGETGHDTTTAPATAVINHLFMAGLKAN